MCGDTECPWCGPMQGSSLSIAEGVYQEWESLPTGTSQDLSDLCSEHDGVETPATSNTGIDGEVWTFTDGSSIELVWGSPYTAVRDASGDIVP